MKEYYWWGIGPTGRRRRAVWPQPGALAEVTWVDSYSALGIKNVPHVEELYPLLLDRHHWLHS